MSQSSPYKWHFNWNFPLGILFMNLFTVQVCASCVYVYIKNSPKTPWQIFPNDLFLMLMLLLFEILKGMSSTKLSLSLDSSIFVGIFYRSFVHFVTVFPSSIIFACAESFSFPLSISRFFSFCYVHGVLSNANPPIKQFGNQPQRKQQHFSRRAYTFGHS